MHQATTVSLQLGFLRPEQGNPISPNLIEIKEENVEGLGGFEPPTCGLGNRGASCRHVQKHRVLARGKLPQRVTVFEAFTDGLAEGFWRTSERCGGLYPQTTPSSSAIALQDAPARLRAAILRAPTVTWPRPTPPRAALRPGSGPAGVSSGVSWFCCLVRRRAHRCAGDSQHLAENRTGCGIVRLCA